MPFDFDALEDLLTRRAAGDDVSLQSLLDGVRAFLEIPPLAGLAPSLVVDRLEVVANALDHLPNRRLLLEIAQDVVLLNVPVDEVQLAFLLKALANTHSLLGDDQQAQSLLWQALRIQERYFLPGQYQIAHTLVALASTYEHVSIEALLIKESFLRRALIIQKALDGDVENDVVCTLMNLATIDGARGDHEAQLDLLEEARARLRVMSDPCLYNKGVMLLELSGAYEGLWNPEKAFQYAKEANAVLHRHCGSGHPAARMANEKVQRLSFVLGRASPRAANEFFVEPAPRKQSRSTRRHQPRL